jgi:predicted nucleic acid-binding protein
LNFLIYEINVGCPIAQDRKKAIQIKQKYRIKLPDAIIAATAILYNIPFITADADFKIIKELDLIFIENN